jgi:hypothetical protein
MLRIWMLLLIALAAMPDANAQPAKIAEFNRVAETALEQHRVFLNCSAPDLETHEVLQAGWNDMIAATVSVLEKARAPNNVIVTLKAITAPNALMLTERPFGEVIRFCQRDKNWLKKALASDFIALNTEAERIFGTR